LHPFQILWSDGLGRKKGKAQKRGAFEVRAESSPDGADP
jgi:hypothetical protein